MNTTNANMPSAVRRQVDVHTPPCNSQWNYHILFPVFNFLKHFEALFFCFCPHVSPNPWLSTPASNHLPVTVIAPGFPASKPCTYYIIVYIYTSLFSPLPLQDPDPLCFHHFPAIPLLLSSMVSDFSLFFWFCMFAYSLPGTVYLCWTDYLCITAQLFSRGFSSLHFSSSPWCSPHIWVPTLSLSVSSDTERVSLDASYWAFSAMQRVFCYQA